MLRGADAPWSIVTGDIDGDGDLDVASTSWSGNSVTWHENANGLGTAWSAEEVATLTDAWAVTAADLDSDGDLDLAFTGNLSQEVRWAENAAEDGATWLDRAIDFPVPGASDIAAGDINGDAELDLAATSYEAGQVYWYEAIPSISIADSAGGEGNSIGVTVDAGRVYEEVTVDVSTGDGSATEGTDYEGLFGELVTIPVGSASFTASVETGEDGLDEANETFFATASSPTNAGLDDFIGQSTIGDDDPKPELSIGDVTVTEKDTENVEAEVTLTLSAASGRAVNLFVETTDSSAKSGTDYVAKETNFSLPAGTTTKTVKLLVKGDKLDEPQERFFLDLATTEADTPDQRAQITITDNDPKPQLSITDVTKREKDSGRTSYEFKLKLNRKSGKTVRVDWKTVKDSARSPADFVSKSGTARFLPRTTEKTVTIEVKSDQRDEVKEKFFVKLSGAVNATIADTKGKGVIKDDD